ncbi:MAG TPA: CHRD domain-containing protein [Thermoleophilaceae bacterium]|jgi:hypothetical protein
MHVSIAAAPGRRARVVLVAAAIALAVLIAALTGPSSASADYCTQPVNPIDRINSCYLPITTGSYSYTVGLSAAAQNATGLPGDPGGTGTSYISTTVANNTVCATTYWSGIDSPVVMAHIHGGAYGQPEDPAVTINLFSPDMLNGRPSGASGCSLAPPGVIGAIHKCPAQFNVVVHSQKHPWAAVRGQLGTTCNIL